MWLRVLSVAAPAQAFLTRGHVSNDSSFAKLESYTCDVCPKEVCQIQSGCVRSKETR